MGKFEVINGFIDKIQWLHEIDYGDFKRKVGLYLSRLESELGPEARRSVEDLIARLRHEVIFAPSGDVEQTRTRVVELAAEIKRRLELRH